MGWHLHGRLTSPSSFFLHTYISRLRSCVVQVKDCAPVIARTKEQPDNEPVNGELQLKEPQWPCMLGIGLDDIKEWNLHWGHGGQAFRKEVLFALYQSAVSHEKKQFGLTSKWEYYLTLPFASLIRSGDSLLPALYSGRRRAVKMRSRGFTLWGRNCATSKCRKVYTCKDSAFVAREKLHMSRS